MILICEDYDGSSRGICRALTIKNVKTIVVRYSAGTPDASAKIERAFAQYSEIRLCISDHHEINYGPVPIGGLGFVQESVKDLHPDVQTALLRRGTPDDPLASQGRSFDHVVICANKDDDEIAECILDLL